MRTFADLLPGSTLRRETVVRDLLLIVGGSMFVAACAKIQIPIGVVPFTMQSFGVVLVGAMLGSRRGALAIVAYLLEGAAGLPVFAGPIGGIAYFVSPSAGYLFGFIAAAFVVGFLAERGWDRRVMTAVPTFALGHVIILTLGFAWLSTFIGTRAAFAEGVLKFLPYDMSLKIMLAAIVLPTAWKLTGRSK